MAKGLTSGYLPIGAWRWPITASPTFFDKGGEFFHGYTYSGHPVACAVALENIRIIAATRGWSSAAAASAALFRKPRLPALADHPLVGEVRSSA